MPQKSRDSLFRNMGKNDFISPNRSIAPATNTFYSAIVISNDDPKGNKRIKARITSRDGSISDDKLKWCVSLNPSGFFMIPQPGEHVIVFLRNPWNDQEGRFYMGPIRSSDSSEFEGYDQSIKKLEIDENGL